MLLAGRAVCRVADDAGQHGSAGLWQTRVGGAIFCYGWQDRLMDARPEVL